MLIPTYRESKARTREIILRTLQIAQETLREHYINQHFSSIERIRAAGGGEDYNTSIHALVLVYTILRKKKWLPTFRVFGRSIYSYKLTAHHHFSLRGWLGQMLAECITGMAQEEHGHSFHSSVSGSIGL